MFAVSVVAAAVLCAIVASYVMWRATSRSALWSAIAGGLLGILALLCAVIIALAMTRAWLH